MSAPEIMRLRFPIGDVTGASLDLDAELPVVLSCHGHFNFYAVDVVETETGPMLSGIRVIPQTRRPISRRDLQRLNDKRMAAAALHVKNGGRTYHPAPRLTMPL